MKIPLRWRSIKIGRVIVSFDNMHWKPNGTNHGACSNPRVMSALLCNLNPKECPVGQRVHQEHVWYWRLWFYFRGGYACHFNFRIDRRDI